MGFLKLITKAILGNLKSKTSSSNATNSRKFEFHSGTPVKTWNENQDIVNRLQFSATMQLRTPLRVLKRHGETHSDINKTPPQIANEMWEGIWIAKCLTFRELGLDIDEFSEGSFGSNIGQIKATEYLPFLIFIREILELNESIETRINKLREAAVTSNWATFVNQHGGIDKIINEFFPRFIDTIPKLNISITDELSKLGIFTANQTDAASDNTLLNIAGIGTAKLKNIRQYCANEINNRDDVRLDKVAR